MITISNQTKPRISGADIVIRPSLLKPAFVKTDEEKAADIAFFRSLRRLKAKCGTNRDDQAFALIVASIGYGINTQRRLVAALAVLDFPRNHVINILNRHAGEDRDSHPWRRDGDGRYYLNN